MTPAIEKLINHFSSLPGIGRKNAARLAYYVMEMPENDAKEFALAIAGVKENVRLCVKCQSFCEGELCPLCASGDRDGSVLCVVEDSKAADAIEALREYNGLFHILHGVISPLDGIGPEQLKIKELLSRLDGGIKEAIIATNPSVEGEATAMYLSKILKPLGIKVTRLAYGLPVGASLEYADNTTLLKAIEGRTEL